MNPFVKIESPMFPAPLLHLVYKVTLLAAHKKIWLHYEQKSEENVDGRQIFPKAQAKIRAQLLELSMHRMYTPLLCVLPANSQSAPRARPFQDYDIKMKRISQNKFALPPLLSYAMRRNILPVHKTYKNQ